VSEEVAMHDQLELRLLAALVGVAFVAVGLVLAANFRGFSAWHARKSIESVKWLEESLSRVPPWSWLLDRPLERRVARQVRLLRVIGVVFAAAGLIVVIVSLFGHAVQTS
jgi:hypothetical protein